MAVQTAPLSAAGLRNAERVTMLSVPESTLMDRAAAAVVAECPIAYRVAVLIGRGNNGGDALLAGALLVKGGAEVTAVLFAPDVHYRGLAEFAGAGGRVLEWAVDAATGATAIADARLVIDGIVGLGGKGGLRPDAQSAIASITPGTPVVSVDLPSGLDPDSGDASRPHVRADVTVTFTAPKLCLVLEPASASAGRVVIADVGVTL